MKIIDKEQVHQSLTYEGLIKALKKGFSEDYQMPARQVYELLAGDPAHNAFAVLPAWNDKVIGVKAFTYFPQNSEKGLDSLYSKIMIFSRQTGEPLAILDGTSITFWRTACISALASNYLSNRESRHLFILGSGNLAPYIIAAHLAVRKITRVSIWARKESKAQVIATKLSIEYPDVKFSVVNEIESCAREADVISCATGASEPLIMGEWLSPGTHLDLIGNHHSNKRECDSLAIIKSKVYVDSKINVLNEAGELLIPIANGEISKDHVQAELSDLCKGTPGRTSASDITLFKSVGTALSDLITADFVLNNQLN
jgi:1-pyrroline-2-carboxylate reductase [NAD(P)H]